MTVALTFAAIIAWLWSALGFVIAFNWSPGAINMGIGVGFVALVFTAAAIFAWVSLE